MLHWHSASLKTYNTFGIEVSAHQITPIQSIDQLLEVNDSNPLVLGGGSNILFTKDVEQPLLKNELKGIEVLREDDHHIWVKVMSGENWHQFVCSSIDKKWYGLENLALIPGTVGAAPIQNIGAYGRDVQMFVEEVHYWHWSSRTFCTLSHEQCRFAYRDSIFKHELKGECFIVSVVFRLNKTEQIATHYGAIRQQLSMMNIAHPGAREVANAVIAIRSSKLPDPKYIGNAGSFFKNPSIPEEQYEGLKQTYPEMPSYPAEYAQVKIPAGWLIEQCGWKGYREDDVGVHHLQALVLVNFGNATGAQLYDLSTRILESVVQKFGIVLEREVQVY